MLYYVFIYIYIYFVKASDEGPDLIYIYIYIYIYTYTHTHTHFFGYFSVLSPAQFRLISVEHITNVLFVLFRTTKDLPCYFILYLINFHMTNMQNVY